MIGVYVITECGPYREALAHSLEGTDRVTVAGAARHPAEALAELAALDPEVALLDVPGAGGPGWARVIAARCPQVRLVVLGLVEGEADIIAWAEAGVSAYVGQEATVQDLVAAIEGVVRGEAACPARTTTVLLKRIAVGHRPSAQFEVPDRNLTPREHEVLRLVGQGLSNQQIARRLCIALPTVKNHVHNILEKLGARSRVEALRAVRHAGLVRGPAVAHPSDRATDEAAYAPWIPDGSFDPLSARRPADTMATTTE